MFRHLLRVRRCASTTSVARQRRHEENVLVDQPLDIPLGESDVNNKTRVSFLSQDMQDTDRVGIRGLSSAGFRMLDDSFLYGPIALFPTVALSWRVVDAADITPESLKLFLMLQPSIDVLVIGVGDRENVDVVRKTIMPTLRDHKIGIEIAPTEDAIPTFNFLNSEYRYVAGGFLPPADLKVTQGQAARSMQRVQSWDTVTTNPFTMDFGLHNGAQEVCKRMFGEAEAAAAFAEVERIRKIDKREKIERFRQLTLTMKEKEREAWLADKAKLKKELEQAEEQRKLDDK